MLDFCHLLALKSACVPSFVGIFGFELPFGGGLTKVLTYLF